MSDVKEIYDLFKDPQQRILQIAALCPDQDIKDNVRIWRPAFKQTGYSTTFERYCHSNWTYRDYYNL